jgi:uncharacterized protein YxjI
VSRSDISSTPSIRSPSIVIIEKGTAVPVEVRDDLFSSPFYLARRKVFKIIGAAFHIYKADGELAFYSKQKAFKLKEDIRIYTDETMKTEALLITARQIIDFSAAYDVIDSTTGEKVGALKRKGWRSMIKDEWIIMDAEDREIGLIEEDNIVLALLRRFLSNLIPQSYDCKIKETSVCTLKRNFNPFVSKIEVDFSTDTNRLFDRRLGLAAVVLMLAIEGRQQ